MTREELNRPRILRAEIERDIRQLRNLEKKERSATQHGQSLLRSLKRKNPANNVATVKAELIHTIDDKQRKYLTMRADLEAKIQSVPDHYLRLVLSLVYVDGLTMQEAASVIQGSSTGGEITQLLARYFEGS